MGIRFKENICNPQDKSVCCCGPEQVPPDEVQHCEWDKWKPISECSKSCGGGAVYLERSILQPPRNGGQNCTGPRHGSKACNRIPCPKDKHDAKTLEVIASCECKHFYKCAWSNEKVQQLS